MGQTSILVAVLENNKAYKNRAYDDVCCATGSSGVKKCKGTIQLNMTVMEVPIHNFLQSWDRGTRIKQKQRPKWENQEIIEF